MCSHQFEAAFLIISSLVLIPCPLSPAQADATQGLPDHNILFVCEHGSAKSVIAAAHFNNLASKKGLPYRAIAQGVHPDKQIPPHVKSGLAAEGLDIRTWHPKRFSEDDALRSDRVITLGCALPTANSAITRKLQEWNDVPSPSENYHNASRAIAERVASLVRDLAPKQTSN